MIKDKKSMAQTKTQRVLTPEEIQTHINKLIETSDPLWHRTIEFLQRHKNSGRIVETPYGPRVSGKDSTRFQIGDLVQSSAEYMQFTLGKYFTGVVVGYSRAKDCIRVLRDGTKYPVVVHPDYLDFIPVSDYNKAK
jgi:hypothetical protein